MRKGGQAGMSKSQFGDFFLPFFLKTLLFIAPQEAEYYNIVPPFLIGYSYSISILLLGVTT